MPNFANTRITVINAPAATIHALVNDFREWTAWSPWEGLDPDMKRTYSGSQAGVGSEYAWEGNNKTGSGSMAITASTPEQIALDLEFLKPFKASNKVTFTFTPVDGGTEVAWGMSGQRNIAFAVLGALFFDKAIAKDYDKGLAQLKATSEG